MLCLRRRERDKKKSSLEAAFSRDLLTGRASKSVDPFRVCAATALSHQINGDEALSADTACKNNKADAAAARKRFCYSLR